ncbi:hypothetical protein CNBA0070 [Cryptococcus deneoformans B-3501A]|uniref:hypothetical protein n=1 Tax=Cryptococcus deneoformans (strain B-3501A) TaxID=283643 RepID=UPI000042F3D0|nr:hypothetical protein CNBA0070 [Cryptococcus neoformans var. neoformans B-3501A]EAL23353.1 hypothetical protein CNBA0070 [Cryptococcus neoformans var. neoformans B-3501A]
MLNPRSLRFDTRQIDYTHHHHDYDYTLPKSTLISLIIGVGTFAVTSILVFFSLRIYLRRRSLRRAQAMSGSGEDLREIMREYLDEGVKGNEGTKPEMWEVEMKYEDEITQPLTLREPTSTRPHLAQPDISKAISIFIAFPAPYSSGPDDLPEIVLGTAIFHQSTLSSTISRFSENEKTLSRNTSEEGSYVVKDKNTEKDGTNVVVQALEYV